ncbi:MAG: sugar transferase [Candidatus Nomurabacteria bacterium]|nr:MAG: sugar transferase [Candidatus Nomurabacteria bacterium]
MKKLELVISAILVPIDWLMIVAAGLASYYLRFTSFAELRPVIYEMPFDEYVNIVLGVAVLWLLIFAMSGLYSLGGRVRWVDEFAKVFFACSTGVMLLIILIFFQRELFSSRFIIVSGWVLSILFVALARIVVRVVQHSLYVKGVGVHRLALVGNSGSQHELQNHISNHPGLGMRVVHTYGQADESVLPQLETLMQQRAIDELVVTDARMPKEAMLKLIELANDYHVNFKYAADRFETMASSISTQTLGGIPIIELCRTPLDGWGKILKRSFDIFGAVIGLIILIPVGAIVALAISIDNPGPIFVRLERIGKANKRFHLYKFRSMVPNAHAMKPQLMQMNERNDGPLFKMKNDPRITRVGRFLRVSSIDELPQLWNVLKGEMSLVGPRPHEPEEVAKYSRNDRSLLTVKPGITGLAQISGRSTLSFEEEVRLDLYYIEHWSLRLDLHILVKTPAVVLSTRSAA